MNHSERLAKLEQLLERTGHAHHQAFLATNGDDPDWPAWYAAYLAPRLALLLARSFDKAILKETLVAAEAARQQQSPPPDWPRFYAEAILHSSDRGTK